MSDVYNSGAELDGRLEKVIESHRPSDKVASEPAPETGSGLQAYVSRPTIAEELAQLQSKIAHVDLREELARDKMDGILETRQSKLSGFLETVKSAAAEISAVDPQKVAEDLIRQGVDPQEAVKIALHLVVPPAVMGGAEGAVMNREHPVTGALAGAAGAHAAGDAYGTLVAPRLLGQINKLPPSTLRALAGTAAVAGGPLAAIAGGAAGGELVHGYHKQTK